jgi:hypothetical protein
MAVEVGPEKEIGRVWIITVSGSMPDLPDAERSSLLGRMTKAVEDGLEAFQAHGVYLVRQLARSARTDTAQAASATVHMDTESGGSSGAHLPGSSSDGPSSAAEHTGPDGEKG